MAGRVSSVTSVCPTQAACMGPVISNGSVTARETGVDCCVTKVSIITEASSHLQSFNSPT